MCSGTAVWHPGLWHGEEPALAPLGRLMPAANRWTDPCNARLWTARRVSSGTCIGLPGMDPKAGHLPLLRTLGR